MFVRRATVWALAASLAAVTALTATPAASADEGGDVIAAPVITVLAGPAPERPTLVAPVERPQAQAAAVTATFRVTYSGFTAEAQAAFQRAVDIWSTQVRSSVPITVNAKFTPLGTNVLGQAGGTYLHKDFAGAEQPGTFYVDAIANRLAGRDVNSAPDINASFSSSYSNWHFGTGAAPAGKYDFTTVVLHELGHGLGFSGSGRISGTTGTVRTSGLPTIYDRFTENGGGTGLLTYPDNSTTLASQLRGNALYFDSPQVRAANGGTTARLHAPSAYVQGSSYSHLDEATYPFGTINSLMTPQFGAGETVRAPGPIALAILDTLGW